MRWTLRILGVVALGLLGAVAWVFWPVSEREARFATGQCRVLPLTDAESGAPILGIEDITAYGPALYLSSQDRLAAEAAVAEGRAAPEGEIYRLDLDRLGAEGPLALGPHTAEGFFGRLHPHGLHANKAKLVVVNRSYAPGGAAGREIRVYAIRDTHLEPLRRLPNPNLCAANDLVLLGIEARLTLDRASCPGLGPGEALWPAATGALARMGTADKSSAALRRTAEGLTYANGIAEVELDGQVALAVAETRAAAVALYRPDWAGADQRLRAIATPGAPDNLTSAPDGSVVAALHPSLPRFALYRYGYRDAAPTRIARIEPETGAVEILWDDPGGAVFPGATVGLLTPGGTLVAGSARAPGLLVCQP